MQQRGKQKLGLNSMRIPVSFEVPTQDGEHTIKGDRDGCEICSSCHEIEDVYDAHLDQPDPDNPPGSLQR